jgi:hypothetical protein
VALIGVLRFHIRVRRANADAPLRMTADSAIDDSITDGSLIDDSKTDDRRPTTGVQPLLILSA